MCLFKNTNGDQIKIIRMDLLAGIYGAHRYVVTRLGKTVRDETGGYKTFR